MRLLTLLASIAILVGCATTTPVRLSSAQILDLAKKELVDCCGISGSAYDISVSWDQEGWLVSALPGYAYPAPESGATASVDEIEGATILTAGGDVQLRYDAYGALLHVYRGQ